jgi:hypothetical protein
MVIAKDAGVSLVRDVSRSRPHKWFTRSPAEPFDIFESALSRVLAGSLFRGVQSNPKVRIQRGDARRLPLEQACIFVPALQRWLEDQVESPRPPQPANSKESSALTDDSFSLPSLTAADETSRLRERASEVCRSRESSHEPLMRLDVRSDSLADDAVWSEPLSSGKFPVRQGKYRELQQFRWTMRWSLLRNPCSDEDL